LFYAIRRYDEWERCRTEREKMAGRVAGIKRDGRAE
jgi:hypothetical protein